MSKLANILAPSKSVDYGRIFNVVTDMSECNECLPTLIIGLENARKYIDGFSILKKEYAEQNKWWTFTKRERRCDYEDDIDGFYYDVIRRYLSDVRYMYVDLIRYRYGKLRQMLSYLQSDDEKICMLTRHANFLFIYSSRYGTVWGISLTLCEYMGISRRKIIDRVKSNPSNIFPRFGDVFDRKMYEVIGHNTHYIMPLYALLTEKSDT